MSEKNMDLNSKRKTKKILIFFGVILILTVGALLINKTNSYNKAAKAAIKYLENNHDIRDVEVVEVEKYKEGDIFTGFDEEEYRVEMLLEGKYRFYLFVSKDHFVVDKEGTHFLAYANISRALGFDSTNDSSVVISNYYEELFQKSVLTETLKGNNVDVKVYFDTERLEECLDNTLTEEEIRNDIINVSLDIKLEKVYNKEEKNLFINDIISIYNGVIKDIDYKNIDRVSIYFNDFNHFIDDQDNKKTTTMLIHDDNYEFIMGSESFTISK